MKLKKKPIMTLPSEEIVKEEVAPKKKSTGKPLPEDSYKDEFPPIEVEIDEGRKFVFSVKRSGELGLLNVDIRQWVCTEKYTGWTKKGINFPVEKLFEVLDTTREVYDKCMELELIEEE